MNMSAKVIKNVQPVEVAAFSIPSIGAPSVDQRSGTFNVPAFDPTAFSAAAAAPAPVLSSVPDAATPEDIVEHARREAARIIAEAEESKALVEQAAKESALIDAAAEMENELAARLGEVRSELADTIGKLAGLSAEIITHVESDLVELALQIAKKVVRREVTIDREIALTLVRVSLSKLHQRTAVEVHLNPEDLNFVKNHLDSLDFRGALNLVEDPSITLGGCLIHTDTGDIDGRVESQFDEIAFGLLQ